MVGSSVSRSTGAVRTCSAYPSSGMGLVSVASLSSLASLLAVVTLSFCVHRTLARQRALQSQRDQALATIDTQRELVDCLLPLMTAARATVSPCPACDLGGDEPCLCQARHQALLAAITGTEQAVARQR